jgi:virginiamycin B lyase
MNPTRPISHVIILSLFAAMLVAQTPAKFRKATGVSMPGVQRSMTTLHPKATFQLGGDPDWLALTDDSVWITNSKLNRIVRLDATTDKSAESLPLANPCSGLAVGFGSLWSPSCTDHNLVRIDLKTRKIVATIPAAPANSEGGIAIGAGSVWLVTAPKGILARIDPLTNRIVAQIEISSGSVAPAFAGGSVWITSTGNNLLTRVDPATNKAVSTTRVGKAPRFLTVGAGSVWTLNQGEGTISRVDATSGKLVATIDAGLSGKGGEITYGEGAIWATLIGFPLTRIDPATNKVTQQFSGKGGDSIRVGLGSIWLTDLFGGDVWRIDPNIP